MKQQKFKVEEFHRGEWVPLMVTDKDGKRVQKVVKITEFDAERMNVYKNDYKLRYVLVEEKAEEVDIDALKAEYEELYGEKPHHKAKAETLIEKIQAKK